MLIEIYEHPFSVVMKNCQHSHLVNHRKELIGDAYVCFKTLGGDGERQRCTCVAFGGPHNEDKLPGSNDLDDLDKLILGAE
jgi:hypothetical protein